MSGSCPACGAPLASASTQWPMLTCHACGGVWTDAAAAARLATAMDREILDVGKLAAQHAAESSPRISDIGRACPVCHKPLDRVRRARVVLDECKEHGTWFDRDELGRVARNLEYERTSSFDVDSADLPRREASEDEPPSTASVGLLTRLLRE